MRNPGNSGENSTVGWLFKNKDDGAGEVAEQTGALTAPRGPGFSAQHHDRWWLQSAKSSSRDPVSLDSASTYTDAHIPTCRHIPTCI